MNQLMMKKRIFSYKYPSSIPLSLSILATSHFTFSSKSKTTAGILPFFFHSCSYSRILSAFTRKVGLPSTLRKWPRITHQSCMGHSGWLKINENTTLPLFMERSKGHRYVPRRCSEVPLLRITLARLTKLSLLITSSSRGRSLPISCEF